MKKRFYVDVNDPEDLARYIAKFSDLRANLLNGGQKKKTRKETAQEKLSLMKEIWQSEVIFSSEHLDPDPKYYVYAHYFADSYNFPRAKKACDLFCFDLGLPRLPFYIGKGCGDRATSGTRNSGHQMLRTLKEGFKKDFEVHIIAKNLTEGEALAMEGKLIDILGMKMLNNGPLANLDEGYKASFRRRSYRRALGELHKYFKQVTPYLGDKSSQMT